MALNAKKLFFLKTAFTFICITPGRDPMRCSMDWTQEPQVIPFTPRETEHRLVFCVMIAQSKKDTRKDKMYCVTYNGKKGPRGQASQSQGK